MTSIKLLLLLLIVITIPGCSQSAKTFKAVFEGDYSEHKWAIHTLNPKLPGDWSSFEFLTFELKSSTAQRWYLMIYDNSGIRQLRMQPFQGAWIRVSIPLRYVKKRNIQGMDMATMGKMARLGCCIGFTDRVGPINEVDSLGVVMRRPIGSQTLEIRAVKLTMAAEDAILEPNPLVDEFGQWIPDEGPGIAKSLHELKSAWSEEEKTLQSDTDIFKYCQYGGYLGTNAKASGFFRVEKIDDKWWLVDPDGHLFFSTGITCINGWCDTRFEGREGIFAAKPPAFTDSKLLGTCADGKLLGRKGDKSFYTFNLHRRFGSDWYQKWIDLTIRRMDNWGINTIGKWSDPDLENSHRKAYVLFLRGWGIETGIMGMPDVYTADYIGKTDSAAAVQCTPRKDDPYLLGYLIGQEPPWVHRELELVDAILAGPQTPMQSELKKHLTGGDTQDRRRTFVYDTYSKLIDIINANIRKYDSNHLILGCGFAGRSPAQIIKASQRCFDVFSFTSFSYVANLKEIQNIYQLSGLPVIIGEFHFGIPGRGLSAGLVQTKTLEESGVAYRYYVENSAVHPAVIGIHWFQWIDQPSTGRMDGENYNTGMVDITDRPYNKLIDAVKESNKRLLKLHSGTEPPVSKKALIQ